MKVAPAPSSQAASSSGHDGWVDVPAIEIDDGQQTIATPELFASTNLLHSFCLCAFI